MPINFLHKNKSPQSRRPNDLCCWCFRMLCCVVSSICCMNERRSPMNSKYERWAHYLAKLLTNCHLRYLRRDCTFLVSTFGLVAPHPIDSSTSSIFSANTLVFSCAALCTRLLTHHHTHMHTISFVGLGIGISADWSFIIAQFRQIDCWLRCFSALLLPHFFLYLLPSTSSSPGSFFSSSFAYFLHCHFNLIHLIFIFISEKIYILFADYENRKEYCRPTIIRGINEINILRSFCCRRRSI